MKVNVAQVRRNESGTAHFELTQDFSSFESELGEVSFTAPVHVHLQVNNTGKSLLVEGKIQTELKAQCGRCLESFTYPINQVYEDEWVFAPQATEEQMETALLFDKDEIELDERILEQIVLALPMRFICSHECKGLCPICGVNRNTNSCDCVEEKIDPRFAALSQWPRED
jgi:uncharacterized protein